MKIITPKEAYEQKFVPVSQLAKSYDEVIAFDHRQDDVVVTDYIVDKNYNISLPPRFIGFYIARKATV